MVYALLIENGNSLSADWCNAIATEGITLKVVYSLATGIKSLETTPTDLLLISGLQSASEIKQFCQQLRQANLALKVSSNLPILLISDPEDYETAIALLEAGADDVWLQSMPKSELIIRLQTVIRRLRNLQSDQFRRGDFVLQPRSRQASFDGINLNLRPDEYDLLELFISAPDRVFSESILLRLIWPQFTAHDPLKLSEIVTELNYKLAVAGSSESLELLYGLGWYFGNSATITTSDSPLIPNHQSIWERYRHEYWQRLDAIALTLAGWEQAPALNRTEAYRHAQTLTGALGSFGFEQESQSARILATGLHALELEPQTNPDTLDALIGQVQQLRVLLGAAEVMAPNQPYLPFAPASAHKMPRIHNHIEVWSCDRNWAEDLVTKANLRGLAATIRTDLESAIDSLDFETVDLVILDLATDQLGELRLVDLVHHHLPVLLVSDNSLRDRIQAARLGFQRFFPKPVSAEAVLDQVFALLDPPVRADTVLIADNDPALLTYLEHLLQPWGWQLALCKRGEQFWEALESHQPDLILLDAALPDYNGLELCRVLRSDRYWTNQPVLILTERYDSELVQQALRSGADDVITKPIVGAELVARIYNRLEKYHQLQRLAATDQLTGLVNQRRAREMLSLLLGLAQRYRQPLTLAVIQLTPPVMEGVSAAEHLQQLIQLATRLQRSCRREDVVTRWTEEQFVLGFYGLDYATAIQRLEQVRSHLQVQDAAIGSDSTLPIRICAGVAEFPIHGTDLASLTQAAMDALNHALQQGGDRILPAKNRKSASSDPTDPEVQR